MMVKVTKDANSSAEAAESRSWKNRPKPANDSEWEFEVPNMSPEGACVQYICVNNRFPWWTKVLKLKYWLHFGRKEGSGYYVKWRDTKNDAGIATQHLIRLYSTSQKHMIQFGEMDYCIS